MELKEIKQEFAVCKINSISQVDVRDEYFFIGKTDEELSLVCGAKYIPNDCIECDTGWRGFRIEGVLDFSLIGILSKISKILADNKIGIFAVSTYNTDYILVKKENFQKARQVLIDKGYIFNE